MALPEILMPELGAETVVDLEPFDLQSLFRAWSEVSDNLVWLDSADDGRHIMGTGARTLVVGNGEDAIAELRLARTHHPGPWVGWLGYEAGVRGLGMPVHESGFPDAAWLRLDEWVVVDGERAQYQRRQGARTTAPIGEVPHSSEFPDAPRDVSVTWHDDDAAYADNIRTCQAHIRDGDSYLMCLTTAITTEPIDEVATHARLRQRSPVHHGGFIRIAGTTLIAASMEQFLHIEGDSVTTKPIKGTRKRAEGSEDDTLAEELRASEKERAENVMIVDLCRNDLQRVCEPGSVHVPSLFAIETYPTVHQLVSTVRGTKLADCDDLDVVSALFPAGSMTGAPKRKTIELLQSIEGRARGIYSGCFGLLTESSTDLAMVIRSIVADDSGAHIGVGGGITALSRVDDEVEEVHVKAAALVDALVPATR